MSKVRMRYVNIDGERYLQIGRHRIKEQSLRGVIRFVAAASMVAIVGGRVASTLNGPKEEDKKVAIQTEYEADTKTVVDVQDLDALNLVLVNGGIDSGMYQETLDQLKEKGVSFESFQEGMSITDENTVIRLVGGKQDAGDIAFYGPLSHEGGNHDNLLVSFEEACEEQGYTKESAHFGKKVAGELGPTTLEQETNGRGTLLTIETKDLSGEALANLITAGLGNYYVQKSMTPNQTYFHIVKAGDTMSDLAEKYGYSSVTAFASMNGIDAPDRLTDGSVLRVKVSQPINASVDTTAYTSGIGRVQ